jgi:hypothetical protein
MLGVTIRIQWNFCLRLMQATRPLGVTSVEAFAPPLPTLRLRKKRCQEPLPETPGVRIGSNRVRAGV